MERFTVVRSHLNNYSLYMDTVKIFIFRYFLLFYPINQESSYSKTFFYLVDKCKEFCLKFSPKQTRVDFEYSIHLAIKNVLPNIKVAGCRFHLGQSWWRKIHQLGLSTI